MRLELSDYGKASIVPSPVNRMMSAFAADFREDIDINLGVGYVNEDTIPRELIIEAMQKVLSNPDKYKTPFNYGGSKGSENLINSIRNYYISNEVGNLTKGMLDKKDIVIGASGATSILEAIADVSAKGIVITTDPMYYIYCNYLERKGFEIVTIPEDENGIIIDELESKLVEVDTSKISYFYIVTVNNPSNSILSDDRREKLVKIVSGLSKKHDKHIPLIFDKAYEELIHNPDISKPNSGLLYDEVGVTYEIGTLSKVLAPAIRVGYMIGSGGEFMNCVTQKTFDVGFSAPLINQEIASYILDNSIVGQISKVNEGYRHKAREIKRYINNYLAEHLEGYIGGDAGFYFYLTFNSIRTTEDSDYFKYLSRTTGNNNIDGEMSLNARVMYIPGEHCVHKSGKMYEKAKYQLRISYGYEELSRIETAIKLMGEACEYVGK